MEIWAAGQYIGVFSLVSELWSSHSATSKIYLVIQSFQVESPQSVLKTFEKQSPAWYFHRFYALKDDLQASSNHMDQWIFASMHELIRFVREDCSGDVVMTILMQLCDTPVPLCATVLRRRWRHTGSTQWYLDWCPRLKLCEPPAKVPTWS